MDNPLIFHHDLNQHIQYQEGAVVSKEVFKNGSGTATLFAFAKGQGLSEHKAPFDALVYIVDGEAEITVSDVIYKVRAGEMINMPANAPHALNAAEPFKMLLVMMKS